jgi:hypothetical protein
VSLLTERSPEQRGQSDHADVRSADEVEDTSATAWYQDGDCERARGRMALPSEQSEHPQDDDDHHDRADDVQDRVHRIPLSSASKTTAPDPALGRGVRCASVHYRWTLGGGRHITGGLSIPQVL